MLTINELTAEHNDQTAIGVGQPSSSDFRLYFNEPAGKVVKMRSPDLQVGEYKVFVGPAFITLTNTLTGLRSNFTRDNDAVYRYLPPLGI
ncbi:hypothetical protein ACSA002_2370 [Salmonella phage vB_SalM_SA002]|nr:hypothetical protein ACSA002_2370 [Salmonella phage vB_SalM_SA002]